MATPMELEQAEERRLAELAIDNAPLPGENDGVKRARKRAAPKKFTSDERKDALAMLASLNLNFDPSLLVKGATGRLDPDVINAAALIAGIARGIHDAFMSEAYSYGYAIDVSNAHLTDEQAKAATRPLTTWLSNNLPLGDEKYFWSVSWAGNASHLTLKINSKASRKKTSPVVVTQAEAIVTGAASEFESATV